ncbi:ABC transporter ATP-binding protein [soil metagenome]
MTNNKPMTKQVAAFYIQHAWRYPRLVVGILLTIPVVVISNGFLPSLILAHVLNRLSNHDYTPHAVWSSFGPELAGYAALVLISGTLGWRLVDHLAWRLEANVERDLAQEVFKHLLSQSANFHANNFTGSLVSQNSKLLGSYIRLADTSMFQLVPLLTSLVIVPILLIQRAPLFVIGLMIFAALYIGGAIVVTRVVRKYSAAHASAESKQTGLLADALANVMAIKSFAHNRYEQQRFAGATQETYDRLYEFVKVHRRQHNIFGTLSSIISSLSLAVAVIGVLVFDANIGTVFLILNYTSNIVSQLFQFSNNTLRGYNRAIGDATDMVKILQIKPEIVDPVKPKTLRMPHGKIEFKNVTFTHDGSDDALFNKLNLRIKAGEKIGLVGHSGSGKSTFTRVLLRFSDIDDGAITIDGQNIAEVTQDDLHSRIAYVPQEPLLFHRSIHENIAYGNHEADDTAVRLAAKRAHADEFIDGLPDKYETLVGERGVKLSGGQRQRIAIARAMLKDAPIIMLDEATSALDSESEILIQDALWKLMEGRTAIVIAHRLSTIQKMDRIIVMDDGAIAEEGSHAELLKQNGTYAKLWAHQSGGFMDD